MRRGEPGKGRGVREDVSCWCDVDFWFFCFLSGAALCTLVEECDWNDTKCCLCPAGAMATWYTQKGVK